MPSEISVVLAAHDEGYDADDPGWRQQVGVLQQALRDAELDVESRDRPVPNQKCGAVEWVLTLGSSGAISAAVVVLQNWLSRVRNRRLEITIDEDGRQARYTVEGSSASDETLKAVLVAALENARRDA